MPEGDWASESWLILLTVVVLLGILIMLVGVYLQPETTVVTGEGQPTHGRWHGE